MHGIRLLGEEPQGLGEAWQTLLWDWYLSLLGEWLRSWLFHTLGGRIHGFYGLHWLVWIKVAACVGVE